MFGPRWRAFRRRWNDGLAMGVPAEPASFERLMEETRKRHLKNEMAMKTLYDTSNRLHTDLLGQYAMLQDAEQRADSALKAGERELALSFAEQIKSLDKEIGISQRQLKEQQRRMAKLSRLRRRLAIQVDLRKTYLSMRRSSGSACIGSACKSVLEENTVRSSRSGRADSINRASRIGTASGEGINPHSALRLFPDVWKGVRKRVRNGTERSK